MNAPSTKHIHRPAQGRVQPASRFPSEAGFPFPVRDSEPKTPSAQAHSRSGCILKRDENLGGGDPFPAHLVYPGSCGMLRWVREFDGDIFCAPTCLERACGVLPDHEDAHGVFVEEIPAEGIACDLCGETHGAGLNLEGQP